MRNSRSVFAIAGCGACVVLAALVWLAVAPMRGENSPAPKVPAPPPPGQADRPTPLETTRAEKGVGPAKEEAKADDVRPPSPKDKTEVASLAEHLTAQQTYLWTHAEDRQRELVKMRSINPEWDLMARSFFVWALANQSLRDPRQKASHLALIDRIIDETIKTEQEQGLYHFLMPYARGRPLSRGRRAACSWTARLP